MKHSVVIAAAALCAAGQVQAQDIVEVPASEAGVGLPEDVLNLPPGQWYVSKLISQPTQPCTPEGCEAGFHSGDFAVSVEHAKDYTRVIAGFRGCQNVAFQELKTGMGPGASSRGELRYLMKKVVKAAEQSCKLKAPDVPKLDIAALYPKAGG